jgi:glutathione S-transferase
MARAKPIRAASIFSSGRPHILFGSEQSLYSGKTRAYLRYRQIPFVEALCTRDCYRGAIIPRVGWPVVPVVQTPEGSVLQDTTEIIDALEADFTDGSCSVGIRPAVPSMSETPAQRFAAELINFFADEWLLLPAMHYRWNKPENEEFLVHEFGNVSAGPSSTPEERDRAGRKAYAGFKATVDSGVLGVTPETAPGIERSYEAFLRDFSAHLDAHQYCLGDRPSLADFGLVAPLYAHLFRDPVPGFLMRTKAPRVADWVERMLGGAASRTSVLRPDGVPPASGPREDSTGLPPAESVAGPRAFGSRVADLPDGVPDNVAWGRRPDVRGGEWAPDDGVPSTLRPLLARQAVEHLPVAMANCAALRDWLSSEQEGSSEARAGGPIPSGLAGLGPSRGARFEAAVAGVRVPLAVRPNMAWMAQRVVDCYHEACAAGGSAGAARVDDLLRGAGGEDAVALFRDRSLLADCPRLTKRGFQLALEDVA